MLTKSTGVHLGHLQKQSLTRFLAILMNLFNYVFFPGIYRFLFHEVNLRRKHESSVCLDTFNITDHFGSHNSLLRASICGEQTDLTITCRSANVTVRLDIGDITADMPKKLGFIATYNTSSKVYAACFDKLFNPLSPTTPAPPSPPPPPSLLDRIML